MKVCSKVGKLAAFLNQGIEVNETAQNSNSQDRMMGFIKCSKALIIMGFVLILTLSGCVHKRAHEDSHHGGPRGDSSGPRCESELDEKAQSIKDGDHGAEVKMIEPWGSLNKVVNYGPVYMSRQPGKKDLEGAKARGYNVIINLADKSELTYNEDEVARNLGLKYYSIPIVKGSAPTPELLNQITEIVKVHHDDKIFMHCASGNRVGAWFAFHMNQDHRWSAEKALKQAETVGLRSDLRQQVEPLLTN